MRIEVKDAQVTTKEGVGKNGKPYSIREQGAWLHNGKPYPVEVRIRLQDEQAAFPPGEYGLTDKAFWVDRWGKLNVDLGHMVPARPAAAVKVG